MKNSFLDEFTQGSKETKIDKKTKKIEVKENEIIKDNSYLKRKRKKIIIMSIITGLGLVIICILVIISNLVEVPELENNLSSIATKWATNNKIEIITKEEYNDNYEEGVVISQSIEKGQKIFKNTSMNIVISKGKDPSEKITIPDFTGKTGVSIKEWINDEGLTNTKITEVSSDKVDKGYFINYSFDSTLVDESNFTRSDVLNIYVSKGDSSLTMGDLTSKSKTDVTKWCTDNNLKCTFKEALSSKIDTDYVISQSIKVGEKVNDNTKLVFTVSLGSGIVVPNYSKYSKDDASSASDKFNVSIKENYSMDVNYGSLIYQSVKAGVRKQETDNNITLVYSIGKPYFASLVGTNESELAKIFYEYNQKGVDFSYVIKYVNSSEEKGTIIRTSKSNEFVTMKENIEVYVSNGINEE